MTVTPNGCQHCGLPEREHFARWKPEPVGWHMWTPPTQEQRLERMQARRAERLRPKTSEPVPEDCVVTFSVDSGPAVQALQNAQAAVVFATHPDLQGEPS